MYSLESRYCRLKLESGGEVLYATVQQYGEVVAGLEELADLTAPVEGREIEVPIRTNVDVETATEESWIHIAVEDDKLVVTIDPNDEPRTRFGTVTYVAGSVSGSFEVTQYPELNKPTSWVITEGTPVFDYPKFNTTASLSAGEEDMYVLRLIPKSSVEGEIDDWVFDNLAVQVRNEILAKVEANDLIPDDKLVKKLEKALDIKLTETVSSGGRIGGGQSTKMSLGDFIKKE